MADEEEAVGEESAEAQDEDSGAGMGESADFPTIEAPEDSELPFAPPEFDPEGTSEGEEE
jgi:hypothetical protein